MNNYLKLLTLIGIAVSSTKSFVNAAEIEEKERETFSVIGAKDARLPAIIQDYVDASNRHDTPSILACFSESAVVNDESKEYKGKKAIEEWVTETIEKYKFQFKPVSFKGSGPEGIVAIEVSGTFDGSPLTLNYHFLCEYEKLVSLKIG